MSVCIYVSIGEVIKVYVGAGWVFFSPFFPPSIVFIFLLSLGWGFFLFHSNGFLRRLAYYKAYLFSPHHIFYFRVSPARASFIGHLASSSPFFPLDWPVGSCSSERKRKKGRARSTKKRDVMDGRGRAEKPWKCSFFLSSGNE